MLFAEQVERHLLAKRVRLHLSLEVLERMIAPFHILGPKGSDDEQALSANAVAEMAQQVDARWIGPVKVFKQEDGGRAGRQGSERITHLAQHALFGCANRLALQLLPGSARKSRRELQAPGRRVCPQRRDDALPARTCEERAERVKERQIGFARSVLL